MYWNTTADVVNLTLNSLDISPSSPTRTTDDIICSMNYTSLNNITFTIYSGLAINGSIIDAFNVTNTTYTNNTIWTVTHDITSYKQNESNYSCWSYPEDDYGSGDTNFTSNVSMNDVISLGFVSLAISSSITTYSNFTCGITWNDTEYSNFTVYLGIAINGSVVDSFTQTNSSYTNNTIWEEDFSVSSYAEGDAVSCWSNATNAYPDVSSTQFSSNVSISSSTSGVNRWYPDSFRIDNARLNASYPIINNNYTCSIDTFTIDDTEISSASFVISGAGVNITAADNESIGSQDDTDLIKWNSQSFQPNTTGVLMCNITVTDADTTEKNTVKYFNIGNELGSCGDNETCYVGSATEIIPGYKYRYYDIIVNSSGSLYQSLTSANETSYGETFYIYADNDFNLTGTMTLSGSGLTGIDGMDAGIVYIYVGNLFTQVGKITGAGVIGQDKATNGGYSGDGGDSLKMYVYANYWVQSGEIELTGEDAGDCTNPSEDCDGGDGGEKESIYFYGEEWNSTGSWDFDAGDGGTGRDSDGGNGGAIRYTYVYGKINKSSGIIGITSGRGGVGRTVNDDVVDGGFGGKVFFLYLRGAGYFTPSGVVILGRDGGDGQGDVGFDGDGGNGGYGIFVDGNVTDWYWNTTDETFDLGDGGDATISQGDGGDGGDWHNTGTDNLIESRDTITQLSQIDLQGGAGGAGIGGGSGGANGDDGNWDIYYSAVGTGNDFLDFDPARTAVSSGATAGYNRSAILEDVVTLTIGISPVYSLQFVNASWSSTNAENLTEYYQLKEINDLTGVVRYLLLNNTESPNVLPTNTSTNYSIDTNRYDVTNYSYYARTRVTENYRFSNWSSVSIVEIYKANDTTIGEYEGRDDSGNRDFNCNFTGYDFYDDGSQWLENESYERDIYFGTVNIIVQKNATDNGTYQTSWDNTNERYEVSVTDAFTIGNHSWWCEGTKANYQTATYTGTVFEVGGVEIILPDGVTSVDFICLFPTISDVEPLGQTSSVPIFKIINNNASSLNFSIGLTTDPTGGNIYFNNASSRTGEHLLNDTANLTACISVPTGNFTACNIYLYADCINATVVDALNVSYNIGVEK